MEAQNEVEEEDHLKNLKVSIDFVIEEIIMHNIFEKDEQIFQLLRLVSPKTNAFHPNRYKKTLVQIGTHTCPDKDVVPQLVSELFYQMQLLTNPIIKAIYFRC